MKLVWYSFLQSLSFMNRIFLSSSYISFHSTTSHSIWHPQEIDNQQVRFIQWNNLNISSSPISSDMFRSQPTVAKQLSTFLPAIFPKMPKSPILPFSFPPPLEVELTEDSQSSPLELSSSPELPEMEDPSDNSLSISVNSPIDQIPSTINSLSPRLLSHSTRNLRL